MVADESATRRAVLSTALGTAGGSLAGCFERGSAEPVVEWETKLSRAGVRWTFAVDGDTVYVATRDGLHLLDAETGNTVGRHRHVGDDTRSYLVYGPPSVDDGVAFYGTHESNTVYAVDDTGDRRWSVELPGGVISCAVGDDLVYVATEADDSGLYAVARDSGDEAWRVDLEDHPATSGPTARGGRVFLESDGVAAFDASTGDLDWRTEFDRLGSPPTSVSGPVVDGSLAYYTNVRESEFSARVYARETGFTAVDVETGDVAWEAATETTLTEPAVRDGVAYAGTRDEVGAEGELFHAFDARDGERLWSADIGLSRFGSADVTDEFVYVMAGPGTIHALERGSGDVEWTRELDGGVSQPIADGDRIYVTRTTGSGLSVVSLRPP